MNYRGDVMLVCTTWKARPLTREQANRMMQVWGKLEAIAAENPSVERLCWYIFSDASGGVTVSRYTDPDAAAAIELSTTLALGEFLEFDFEDRAGPGDSNARHFEGLGTHQLLSGSVLTGLSKPCEPVSLQ